VDVLARRFLTRPARHSVDDASPRSDRPSSAYRHAGRAGGGGRDPGQR
jgi:hypothetical protein